MDTTVFLLANLSDFQSKMAVARGEMDKTAKAGGSSFSGLGKAASVATAAIAAGAIAVGVESVKMASNFDSAMETIHTQAGASQAEVDKMKNAVLGLAGPTATAPIVLADALYHIESNGIRGAKALNILKIAAEGAKIGHADLTDTTNALTAAINSGIPGVSNFGQAMGAVNAIVGSGDMQMQDLNEAFSTGIVVIAKQFGASLNDVGAALATFGDNNIRGADAATKLRMAIMDMAKQSAGGEAALAKIGIKAGELGKDMQTGGLGKALTDLKTHLTDAGITGDKVGQVLTDAFTKKSAAPLSILIDQLSRFDSKQKAIAAGATQFGTDWAATTAQFSTKMQALQANAEALGIKLGNVLIPILEDLMTKVAEVVGWLEKHRQVAQDLAVTLGVLAAAILVVGVVSFIAANALTLGIGVAIAGLIIAAVYLESHWHQVWLDIQQWTSDAIDFLRGRFGILILAITGPFAPLLLLALHWQQMWNDTKTWTLDGVNAVVGFFVRMATDIKTWTLNAVNAVVGFFERMWTDATRWGSRIWTDTVRFFQNLYNGVTGVARNLWTSVVGFFQNIWNGLVGANGWVSQLPGAVLTKFENMVFFVLTEVGKLPGALFSLGAQMIGDMVRGLTTTLDLAGQFGSWLHSQLNKALSFLGIHLSVVSGSSTFFTIGAQMMKSLAAGIIAHAGSVTSVTGALTKSVTGTLGSFLGTSSAGKPNAPGTGTSGLAPGGFAAIQALGQSMAASYGWTGTEWQAFNQVVMDESGWNPTAQNPTSSAYGIAQNINGRAGYPDPSPAGQIAWMLAYIKGRYGDPMGALAHENAFHWYDQGGWLPTGLSLAMNQTGRPERILGPGESSGVTVIVNVNGSVTSEQNLVNAIHTGLLQKQRNVSLGFK